MTINRSDRTSISAHRTARTDRTGRTAFIKPILLVAGAALVAGCTATGGTETTTTGSSGGGAASTAAPAPDITADLAGITTKDVAKISPTRLADGLVAPTNRWFSGLVFGDQPLPVFPMPLSAALTEQGFAIGLPIVTESAKAILGGTNPQIQVPLGASSMKVTGYDTLTVTSTYYDGAGAELGSVLLAQGSPFVTYTAAADQTLAIEPIFKSGGQSGLYTTNVAGHDYGLVVGGGATVGVDGDQAGKVTLTPGSTITLYGVPDGADAASLAAVAADPVTGGSVEYSVDGDHVTTTLQYATKNGGDTAIVPMADQAVAAGTKGTGTYGTVYGTTDVYTGTSLTTSAPLTEPSYQLDVSNLSDEDKAALVEQVRTDAAAIDFTATDTYFGGKYLYRGANLMTLAEQLGVDDVAADLRTRLTAELQMWFDPQRCATEATKCFVYDDQIKSLIGQEASFGSDELNDHHFHYGYLIYAAAVVSANDSALADKISPVVDLAVADIASAQPSSAFPQYRNFDPYSGHSWASGSSPFADGNNQESSSEAVNAWNAVALWAKIRGNADLQTQATWMMSTEANAAKLYWTDTDLSEFPAFTGTIAAMNWGGKRDYATWFSAEPGAMLGIQLIPMGSYSTYLAGDADRIKANLEQGAAGGYGVQFGEYMAQYLALADPAAARSELANLPAEIDNATTKSYVMAYVLARADASGS